MNNRSTSDDADTGGHRGSVATILRQSEPLDFQSLLARMFGTLDTLTLRDDLGVALARGEAMTLIARGRVLAGPWSTSGNGQPDDPWDDIDGSRLHYRRGRPFETIWSDSCSPYRKRHLQLVRRDGPTCALCSRAFPEHYAPEQDHRIPRSLGGGNELANLQLTHKVCNMVKGTRAAWVLPPTDEVTVWFDPVDGSWREVLSRGVYTETTTGREGTR